MYNISKGYGMHNRYEERRKIRQKNRLRRKRRKMFAKGTFLVLFSVLLFFFLTSLSENKQIDKAVALDEADDRIINYTNEALAAETTNIPEITGKITKEGYGNELINFLKTDENTVAYKKPTASSERLYIIDEKTIEVFGVENNWVKIKYNQEYCYVKEENLKEIEDENLFKVIDGILLINDEYGVDESYVTGFNLDAQSALNSMLEALERAGFKVSVGTRYRSIKEEKALYEDDSYSHSYNPKPGHSEFQSGTAIELHLADENPIIKNTLLNSQAGEWLYNNSYKYGFILRFPESKKSITGYNEEGIFKYVGVQKAQYMFNQDLCLEEYLAEK